MRWKIRNPKPEIRNKTETIFITGTDTGVGKTVLTALLLAHLRANGARAAALKPFCSGDRADAELLCALQEGDLAIDEINPFYFSEPLAPLVAARIHRRSITLRQVLAHIERIRRRGYPRLPMADRQSPTPQRRSCVLVEGAGGVFVPLGEGYLIVDLIRRLKGQVIVVAANKLGVINHALLTFRSLRAAGLKRLNLVLMDQPRQDASSRSNPAVLAELLAPVPVFSLPFLGSDGQRPGGVRRKQKQLKRILGRILAVD